LTAWDKLPRFTFLDADLHKLQDKEQSKSRIKMPNKSIFVGSPVRLADEGGMLMNTLKRGLKKINDDGDGGSLR
jgi:hypothetical protein